MLKRAEASATQGSACFSKKASPASWAMSAHSKAAAMVALGSLSPPPPPPPPSSLSPPPPPPSSSLLSASSAASSVAMGMAPPSTLPRQLQSATCPPKAGSAAVLSPSVDSKETEDMRELGQMLQNAMDYQHEDHRDSGIRECLVSTKSPLAKVSFSSPALAQLFLTYTPGVFTRAEFSSDSRSTVFMAWSGETEFNQTTLQAYLSQWIEAELD